MNDASPAAACQRFRAVDLHDSMLCGISIQSGCDAELQHPKSSRIRLDIQLFRSNLTKQWFEPAVIEFEDCTYTSLRVDLAALAGVAFQISHNSCSMESPLRDTLEALNIGTPNSFEGFIQFGITLIHPSGEIIIFARDFELHEGHGETKQVL